MVSRTMTKEEFFGYVCNLFVSGDSLTSEDDVMAPGVITWRNSAGYILAEYDPTTQVMKSF